MRIRDLGVLAALALPVLFVALPASADDEVVRPGVEAPSTPGTYVLSFPDGAARFHVVRDLSTGTMIFRTAEGTTVTKAPVITLRSAGEKEVVLTAVAADKGSWKINHEALKADKFDGTIAVIVGDRTLTTPLMLEPMRVGAARKGGQLLRLTDCGKNVEIVQDVNTGSITVYSTEEVKLVGPVLVVTEPKDAGEIKFVEVSGEPGAWRATHATLKTVTLDGKFRVTIDGKVCETQMVFAGPHGGRIVRVANGPRFEVVQDPKTGYVLYALDETIDGKTVVIENPKVTWTTAEGPKTVVLQPVENQSRAWRLVGLDGSVREPGDARLSFTLFGRTLDTALGLTNTGVSLR
jgi:hypothetical protein